MKKIIFYLLLSVNTFAIAQTERLNGQVGQGSGTFNGGIVADPGFELGTPNSAWTEFSSNFGTPICDVGGCGTGLGTGPNTGSFWTWFGGITGAVEEGSVSQSITIPPALTVNLSFEFEAAVCDGTGFLEVLINSTDQVFFLDESDPACGVLGYSTINVDLSAYQGQTVDLEFHSITQGDAGVNLFIDDVSVTASGTPVVNEPVSVPSLQWYGIFALLLLVGFMTRRKFQ